MAPVIPFMTEHIWQKLVRETEKSEAESIHLSTFPTVEHYGYQNLIDDYGKTTVEKIIFLHFSKSEIC